MKWNNDIFSYIKVFFKLKRIIDQDKRLAFMRCYFSIGLYKSMFF